jgi:hypothetical protein
MPTNKKATPKKRYYNNNLPTLYIDDIDISLRKDGMNYLSFTTNTPDLIVEQVRLMIDDEDLRYIIDDLCLATNYFPQKPKKSKKTEKTPSK